MLKCSHCGKSLHSDEAAILWDHKRVNSHDTVKVLVVVHRSECDEGAYPHSAGAVHGRRWHPDTHGTERFKGKIFEFSAHKQLLEQLIAQRRIDYSTDARAQPTTDNVAPGATFGRGIS